MYYAGNFFIFKKTHLALGGGSIFIDKKEITPTIDIIEEHKNILQHFLDWEILFTNILSKINDKKELRKKLESLKENN
jgi:hypothetical protein